MSLDRILITVAIVLSVATAASVIASSLHVHFVAPSLDLVLDTVATVVTFAVALLAWARFREHRLPWPPGPRKPPGRGQLRDGGPGR